jgi:hypothetical protein
LILTAAERGDVELSFESGGSKAHGKRKDLEVRRGWMRCEQPAQVLGFTQTIQDADEVKIKMTKLGWLRVAVFDAALKEVKENGGAGQS